MASPVPKPVSACLGLVPTVLDGIRRLPGKAVQLPVIAVSSALAGVEYAKREYGDLAGRGERLVARLRGTSFDELEDGVEDRLAGTPVASLYDLAEDRLEDLGSAATQVVKDLVDLAKGDTSAAIAKAGQAAEKTGQAAAEATEAAHAFDDVVQETLPVAEQPKGSPTPKAEQPDATRVDSAATPDVVQAVEEIAGSTPAPDAADLPLPDYDHMTLGSLRGRLRSLSVDQLGALRAYEKSKADRLPVVTMLDNRIAKLAAGEGAPTGTAVTEPSPKASTAKKPPKKVGSTSSEAKNDAPPHTKVRTT
jgi:hypothetical protein